MDTRADLLNYQPTFCMTIPKGHGLTHIGLRSGDVLMCDYTTSPARFVVGSWGGLARVCTNIDGRLFDEGAQDFGPEEAKILGRVLYASRSLVAVREE